MLVCSSLQRLHFLTYSNDSLESPHSDLRLAGPRFFTSIILYNALQEYAMFHAQTAQVYRFQFGDSCRKGMFGVVMLFVSFSAKIGLLYFKCVLRIEL